MNHETNRRSLLKSTAWSGAALVLPFWWPDLQAKQAEKFDSKSSGWMPNAFLVIEPDNSVLVYAKHLEMGQGVYTGLPTILAEELDADWTKIQVRSAPADAKLYRNLFWGTAQGTGGSGSIANSWQQLRLAGAQARAMLLTAAAETWKLPVQELKTENSYVLHSASSRKLAYGDLVALARKQTIPENPTFKTRDQYKLIGNPQTRRLDGESKTNGTAIFTLDVRLPGQLVALVARPPRFGAKLKKVKDTAARAQKGVLEILTIPQGVAVIAENFWSARKARDLLEITWDETKALHISSDELEKDFQKLLEKPGKIAFQQGQCDEQKNRTDGKSIEATFTFPYLAHAPMEPLNCVIKLDRDGCEIWAGSQTPTGDQNRAASILGLKASQVKIHTTLAGGSFGRRSNPNSDYIAEAAEIIKASKLKKHPIHLIWTREDDIRGGYYRPFTMHKIAAGLDSSGQPLYWQQRIATQSLFKNTPFEARIKDGLDPTATEGAANLPYKIPHRQCELQLADVQVPVLWWRSVGHTHTAFVAETVIDELATLAGKDPVAYRLQLLEGHSRLQSVLKTAAEMADWNRKRPSGTALGVAVHGSFRSFVAEVVQVSQVNGRFHLDKVWCAVDCGLAINPDIIKAQMQGGIGFAWSAMLREAVIFREGRVQQSNFHDYAVLRMKEMPEIEVTILDSKADPTGVGEPGVPPLAPAVANAIAALTGKRLRQLPLPV